MSQEEVGFMSSQEAQQGCQATCPATAQQLLLGFYTAETSKELGEDKEAFCWLWAA